MNYLYWAGLFAAAWPIGPSTGQGSRIECSVTKVVDSGQSGLTAFTFLVPQGWKSRSTTSWRNNLFLADFSADSPDRQYFVHHTMPVNMVYSAFSGGKEQGLRIGKATDLLEALLPRIAQTGKLTDITILDEKIVDLPLTQIQRMGQQTLRVRGTNYNDYHQYGFLKAEATINGIRETVSLGTQVIADMTSSDQTIGYGATARPYHTEFDTYTVGPTMFVGVPVHPDAEKVEAAKVVASTVHITPKFAEFEARLALANAKAGERAAMERSKSLVHQMQQDREKSMVNFRQSMANKSAATQDYCDYILDQHLMRTPGGDTVMVPSNFGHGYIDDGGHVVLTQDADPPHQPGWHEMQVVKRSGD